MASSMGIIDVLLQGVISIEDGRTLQKLYSQQFITQKNWSKLFIESEALSFIVIYMATRESKMYSCMVAMSNKNQKKQGYFLIFSQS